MAQPCETTENFKARDCPPVAKAEGSLLNLPGGLKDGHQRFAVPDMKFNLQAGGQNPHILIRTDVI